MWTPMSARARISRSSRRAACGQRGLAERHDAAVMRPAAIRLTIPSSTASFCPKSSALTINCFIVARLPCRRAIGTWWAHVRTSSDPDPVAARARSGRGGVAHLLRLGKAARGTGRGSLYRHRALDGADRRLGDPAPERTAVHPEAAALLLARSRRPVAGGDEPAGGALGLDCRRARDVYGRRARHAREGTDGYRHSRLGVRGVGPCDAPAAADPRSGAGAKHPP